MKIIKCGVKDRSASKKALKLWHITADSETTLCGYNMIYLLTDPLELEEERHNLCSDCATLAKAEGK